MSIIVVFGEATYAEINSGQYPHETCTAVSQYIIRQYIDSYEAGNTKAEIKVPANDNDPSNYPFCDYGAQRIASNLWWHGMTKIKMDAVFVPDKAVNEMFGLN